jgi:Helicase conserved C-terminal domain
LQDWKRQAEQSARRFQFFFPREFTMNDPLDAAEPIPETAEEIAERLGFYAEIKRALVARGIPEKEIAFIHDFPSAASKLQAFREINAGRIRVMIASTDRAGCGANFQERLIASHNLSIPWKPSELEQREGRIVRQGNIFPEVYICNYVTEGSFDAYQWQTIESKARFISQIMAGEVTARTAEDVDQLVVTAAQIKAIASGNPQILEKVAVEVELTKLERLYSAWIASRQRLRGQMESLPAHLESVAHEIVNHRKAIATRDRNEHDEFTIDLRRSGASEEIITFTDRGRAGGHLRQLCFAVDRESRSRGAITRVIGRYRGFEIVARASGRQLDALSSLFSEVDLFLRAGEGEMSYGVNLGESDAGVAQSMDAQLRGLESRLEKSLATQRELEHRRNQIAIELGKGWEPAGKYQELKLRLGAINQSLIKSGAEIEASPELSNLAEDALQPIELGVGFHQILSLAEDSGVTAQEETDSSDEAPPSSSESPAVRCEEEPPVTSAGAQLVQNDDGVFMNDSRVDAECEPANDLSNALSINRDGVQGSMAKAANCGAVTKLAATTGPSQQMSFDWS